MKPYLVKLNKFYDDRGWFMTGWNRGVVDLTFVQENIVHSRRGVLRGMHSQNPPQGKFIRCLQGQIYDVVADEDSCSWTSFVLTPGVGLYVPPGYLHGYQVLTDTALVSYLVTSPWNKDGEITVRFDSPKFGIHWPIENPIVSAKDEIRSDT
jgi:dTDP-4-dehydrorhamnose 3,5-epimerase